VIQAPVALGELIMRYDLTDFEWSVIEPVLPKGRPGPRRKDDRRVMNGVFWVLRTGAPWRDLPERYGPYTTAYNRFNRWRKAGVWDRLMDAVSKAHGGNVQMIDSSIVRVHQHASGVKKRVEIVVWGEAEAGSRRKSMRGSTAKAGQSNS
jgi:transposase